MPCLLSKWDQDQRSYLTSGFSTILQIKMNPDPAQYFDSRRIRIRPNIYHRVESGSGSVLRIETNPGSVTIFRIDTNPYSQH